MFNSVDVTCKK